MAFGHCELDVAQVERTCAQLICHYLGCPRVALGPSGGCSGHAHVFLGNRAKGIKRPDIGPKISAAKMGHPTSPEARAKMAAAKRKHEPKRRFCERCGEKITPHRAGLEDVSHDVVEALGLDLVPGYIITEGGGRFCNPSHAMLWAWTHDRERFPQDGPGPSEQSCAICRRTVERWPSQVANALANGHRFICSVCMPIYRCYGKSAERAADSAKPRAPFSEASLTALERVWTIGDDFADEIIKSWPRTGRRPPLAVDLVIATFHRRGFTDTHVSGLLNHALGNGRKIPGVKGVVVFDAEYVKQRRNRIGIHRVVAA